MIVHTTEIPHQSPITLEQHGPWFTVKYGSEVLSGLNYVQAAKEYGLAIMHTLHAANRTNRSN